jgi:hypothetical protein
VAEVTPVTGTLVDPPLLAADPDGNVVVAADFTGDVEVGGVHVTSTSGFLVAKLVPAASLAPQWAATYEGSMPPPAVLGLRAVSCGDVLLSGVFTGTMDLGCGPMSSLGGGQSLFFGRLGP